MYRYIIFFIIVAGFRQTVAQNFDIRLLRTINHDESPFRTKFAKFESASMGPFAVAVPLGSYIYGFKKHDKKIQRQAINMFIAAGLNAALTTGIKYGIDRTRPYITYPDIIRRGRGGSPSFPSGHTSTAFCMATSFTLQFPKWYIAVPAYIYAAGVAYSRMYQGVHYPSDVLAGALIGSGSAWLCWKLQHGIEKKYPRKAKIYWDIK